MIDETLWTVSDVARFLHVAPKTVYRLAQSGRLPAFKMGWVWRFRAGEVRQWLESQRRSDPRGGRTRGARSRGGRGRLR